MEGVVRHIPNPSPDWTTYKVHLQNSGGSDGVKYAETVECKQVLQRARMWLKEKITEMHKMYPPQTTVAPSSNPKKKDQDSTIYTGAGGNAYMHWKLSCFYSLDGDEDRSFEHLMKALEAVNTAVMLGTRPGDSGVAFYVGATGIHALAAVLYHQYKEPPKVEYHLEQLLSFLQEALNPSTPDELLFGRAGYLSCLLFVKKHLPKETCERMEVDKAMKQVFTAIVQSGIQQGQRDPSARSKRYFKFFFYGSDYLGAAHGVAGIMYILLQFPEWCKEPDSKPWITGTLDHFTSIQMPGGNFPAKDSGRRDGILVHWCHGAPGFISLLHKAYEVFGDTKYLKSMEMALECVWKYGVLKKGFGICHGITGNAYFFLLLYKETGQDEYYYKALQMAECVWSEEVKKEVMVFVDPQRYKVGIPDCPYSLMEGLAGTICFFCDVLYPKQAAFPGYDGEF